MLTGENAQDCSNKLFHKSVLRDCISMCFDICTIDIPVSIRVRGLGCIFFVFFYPIYLRWWSLWYALTSNFEMRRSTTATTNQALFWVSNFFGWPAAKILQLNKLRISGSLIMGALFWWIAGIQKKTFTTLIPCCFAVRICTVKKKCRVRSAFQRSPAFPIHWACQEYMQDKDLMQKAWAAAKSKDGGFL